MLFLTWDAVRVAAGPQSPRHRRQAAQIGRAPTAIRVNVTFAGMKLRDALRRVREVTGENVMLDRRVDPTQTITINQRDATARSLYQAIANQAAARCARVGSVYYIGPAATADLIATVMADFRDQLGQLPRELRRRLTQPATRLQWPEAIEPRRIVDKLIERIDLPVVDGLQLIEHDLWPAAEFSNTQPAELLVLVLANFQLRPTITADGRLDVVVWPERLVVEQSYLISSSQARSLAQVHRRFPDDQVDFQAGKLIVQGRWEHHEAVRERLEEIVRNATDRSPGRRRLQDNAQRRRFDLRVQQQPIGALIAYLERELGLVFDVPAHLRPRLQTLVNLETTDATLDQLIAQLADASGWSMQRNGHQVTVSDQR